MREHMSQMLKWWRSGEPFGLATVVATFESAPRTPGATMMVGSAGDVVGSISGGCVEGAVYELAETVIDTGRPVAVRYGVSDESAMSVGLTCGGIIDVFIERVDRYSFPELEAVISDIQAGVPIAIATVIDHPDESRIGERLIVGPEGPAAGRTDRSRFTRMVTSDARGLLNAGHSGVISYGPKGERLGEGMRIFVGVFAPPPRMIIFGATDFAAALAVVGRFMGYDVSVCDARSVFATRARFPASDRVVTEWPHRYLAQEAAAGRLDERTVLCVLTHDPKFDVPLLATALALPGVGYIGVMGSRQAHDDRLARLRDAGVSDERLARLNSPIGLDLGARTPEETAISIAAEIVAWRWGGTGASLSGTAGRIHRSALVMH